MKKWITNLLIKAINIVNKDNRAYLIQNENVIIEERVLELEKELEISIMSLMELRIMTEMSNRNKTGKKKHKGLQKIANLTDKRNAEFQDYIQFVTEKRKSLSELEKKCSSYKTGILFMQSEIALSMAELMRERLNIEVNKKQLADIIREFE